MKKIIEIATKKDTKSPDGIPTLKCETFHFVKDFSEKADKYNISEKAQKIVIQKLSKISDVETVEIPDNLESCQNQITLLQQKIDQIQALMLELQVMFGYIRYESKFRQIKTEEEYTALKLEFNDIIEIRFLLGVKASSIDSEVKRLEKQIEWAEVLQDSRIRANKEVWKLTINKLYNYRKLFLISVLSNHYSLYIYKLFDPILTKFTTKSRFFDTSIWQIRV